LTLGLVFEFPLQLVIRLQPRRGDSSLFHRGSHRAARFLLVPAIAEVAVGAHRLDVRKRVERAFPELHLAHARRIDNQSTARQDQQLAMRGGMAAALILVPHVLDPLPRFANQRVDERRLADVRAADERDVRETVFRDRVGVRGARDELRVEDLQCDTDGCSPVTAAVSTAGVTRPIGSASAIRNTSSIDSTM
jgi:hypothetical protein